MQQGNVTHIKLINQKIKWFKISTSIYLKEAI